ncbi:MAG TPA: protein-export chaperone SecB [Gammaproteobacteria bacterium]|nr:protein-export chaperone SecB [Gammaproteobacteria bacterium]
MAEEATPNPQPGQTGTGNDNQFVIQKVYVKDLSFETPNSPQIFLEKWAPDVKLQLRSQAAPQAEGVHEVVLTVVVTASMGEKTAYLAEVQQAGIFSIKGFNDSDLGAMLGSYCPNILFPYARETVSDLVARGGFPQLVLAPVNFDALYAHMQSQQGQGESAH